MLWKIAEIVHEADLGDKRFDAPEAPGLDVLLRGLSMTLRTAAILVVGLTVWFLPVAALALLTGGDSVYTQQGLFFSGTAVVTFGGAYAVLSFVAQRAVEHYGWLSAGDMVRGLALAESTPGR